MEVSGEVVPLPSRAFDVLLHLASRSGALAAKADLKEAGWPDVTVGEASLTQCIYSIRKALAPSGARIITESGRGYRFVVANTVRGGETRAEKRSSTNAQAYQLYVSGWSALSRPGKETLPRAIERLEEAVKLDPSFALAHVCLADAHACMGAFGYARSREVLPKARASIERALTLDPNLAEAYSSQGHIQGVLELNPRRAEASLRRALELDPHSPIALFYMGLLMEVLGRFDEAMEHFRRAQVEEPLAPNISTAIGGTHYHAGRYREAISQLEAALELDPEYGVARAFLGRSCLRLGEFERAIAEFKLCKGPTAGSAADLPSAYALSGRVEEARQALGELIAPSTGQYISPRDIAAIHAALGENEQALTWLERAVEEAAPGTSFIKVDPDFTGLTNEPRYQSLLDRCGLR